MRSAVRLSMVLCLLICTAYGQDKPKASKGYGHVEFVNSGLPAAQADFLDGMALLHDFEYALAAAAFRRAEAADPGFAMAYWGEAMTFNHPIWMQQDLNAGRAALAKLGATPAERRAKAKTEREKAYMDAAEALYGDGTKFDRDFLLEKAMAKIHASYPDDVDATAFYGLAMLGTAHAGRDVATYMRAAGVMEEAWTDHQDHPGLVHYLIHCYDDPTHAPLGLRAARIYARIAPNAGHAQHMTSHIFVALGMWPEVVQANLAAIAVVNKVQKAAGKREVGCGHYPTWLNYGYLQIGQPDDAKASVDKCRAQIEAEAATARPTQSMDPDDSSTASYSNMRLRYLIDAGSWPADMAGWTIPALAGAGARLDFEFARFLGEIGLGRTSEANAALKSLDDAANAVVDIETKKADPDPSYRVRPEILKLEARGILAEKSRDFANAEKLFRQAVELEEKLPMAFGPPVIDKPTHELLGEFLLRRGRKQDAQAEFTKAVARTPGRRLAVQGLAASGQR